MCLENISVSNRTPEQILLDILSTRSQNLDPNIKKLMAQIRPDGTLDP